MKCAFCGSGTEERFEKDNVIVFSHFWCLEDRMTELDTGNLIDCLVYEDNIKQIAR